VGNKPVQDITSNIVELIAYDKMIRFDRNVDDLLARIAFPCTLSDIYDELCELVVVDKTSGDEIPDVMNRQIANANDWEFDTCREVLAAIAEATGCYAKITNDGELKFIWFEDHTSDQTLTLDNCFDGTIIKLEKSYSKKWGFLENTKWKNVESVQYGEYDNMNNPFEYSYIHYLLKEVINEQNNRDVMQPTYHPYGNYKLGANVESYQWENVEIIKWKELETSDDVAGGIYLINNNPFLLYATDAEIKTHLQHILDRLILFHLYYVASVTMVGNWLIEPGDTVMLEVMKNTFVEYPIFNRVLKWNGSCQCDYETTGGL
jgi:rRNA-processing protein FCF1